MVNAGTEYRPRVLVVDDSPEIASRLIEILREVDGLTVVGQAFDGRDALEQFRRTAPDAVVLDLVLPGMNGLSVLRAIRDAESDCLICVLTNVAGKAAEEECLAAGADCFLRKSTQFDQVADVLGRHFATRPVRPKPE